MNGAESLVRTLVGGGVDVCFATPGPSEIHFGAALARVDGMRCVWGFFEGVVTGAADGYYRRADNPAATLLHLGPGLANGLANIHNANKAASGMVNIIGDHATYHRQYDAPLTSDIEGLARPSSHWVKTSPDAMSIARDGAAAIAAARPRAGVGRAHPLCRRPGLEGARRLEARHPRRRENAGCVFRVPEQAEPTDPGGLRGACAGAARGGPHPGLGMAVRRGRGARNTGAGHERQ